LSPEVHIIIRTKIFPFPKVEREAAPSMSAAATETHAQVFRSRATTIDGVDCQPATCSIGENKPQAPALPTDNLRSTSLGSSSSSPAAYGRIVCIDERIAATDV
jgi:hypothetical protein